MGIQNKVLTKSVAVDSSKLPVGKTFAGTKGVLALGKPGDILSRAYGPVIRAAKIATADVGGDGYAKFGTYVAGKGILVNSGDCAAIGPRFDTVVGLKAGQVGSFLVSGACAVEGKAVQAIANAMKVQYLDEDYKGSEVHTADENLYAIEVNGFDNEIQPSTQA